MLFASLVWGTTGTAATFAPGVSPAAMGAAAMGLGGLAQALLAGRGIAASLPLLGQTRRLLLAGGLAVAVYPLAFYASMRLAGVTVGTVVTIGSAPLLAAAIERLLEGARLSRRWMAGALTGIAGMALLAASHGAGGGAGDHATTLGVLLGLVGGLTYALYSWTARQMMLDGIPSSVAMGSTFGLGGLLLLPLLIATGAPLLASRLNFAVAAYMALVPMFLGYVSFGFGLARVTASTATTLSLLEPVVAAALAMLVVGERLTPGGWVGAALILLCLWIVTLPQPAGPRARG